MTPGFCVKIFCHANTVELVGTGVVIHPRWVLTAWHVTWPFFESATQPRIVTDTQTVDGIARQSHILSPSSAWLGPDLALIESTTDLNVAPVHWASAAAFDAACGGSFVGFGPPPGDPLERACTFDLARCVTAPGRYGHDPAINFVAVQPPGVFFHGDDSGGPLLIATGGQLKLAGILSRGTTPNFSPHGPVGYAMRKSSTFYFAARLYFFLSTPWARGSFTRTDAHKPWAEGLTGQVLP